jgi:CRISPR-associated protein Csh1
MFENLKVFVPTHCKISNIYGDYSKSFLEIVGRIFKQKPISYMFIIERFMSIFRRKWTNKKHLHYDIEKMINIIYFLHYLKLIDLNKQPTSEVTMEEKYQQFLTENEEFLNSDAKRGLFLFGVLTQFLLDIQHIERDATPFRKQLNSLKLSPAYIRKLYPQVIEKFEQYGKNYYRKLEGTISELFLTAKMDDLTNDEISFYFTTGMTLANKFRNTKKDDSNEEE